MQFDVVSLGLACADVMVKPVDTLPRRGTLELVPQLELHLGGLAAATAVVLSKLGARTAFAGMIGSDGFGDYLARAFENAGVDTQFMRRTDKACTPATVVVIDANGERTFLHHSGTSALFSDDDVDSQAFRETRWVHWGGPGVTPGLDGVPIGRLLERAKVAGCTTSFDTCYDGAGLWGQRIEHALPYTDCVMASLEEAREYTGQSTKEDIARYLLDHGPSIALIKLGDQGVYAADGRDAFTIPAHKVTVVDTTGAGDAACAGFIYGRLAGWPLEESARLANAVGGLTVQKMGGAEAVDSLEAATNLMNRMPAHAGQSRN